MSTQLFIPNTKRRTGSISTDSNDDSRRNGSPNRVNRLRTAAGRVGSTPINLNNMITMGAALFPLLDDITGGLVASFLPLRDLGLRWVRGVAAAGTAVLCCIMSTCANGIVAGGVNELSQDPVCDYLLARFWPFFRALESIGPTRHCSRERESRIPSFTTPLLKESWWLDPLRFCRN